MNKCRHLLLLALLGLITACSLNELPENLSPLPIEEDGLVLQVETRAETYKGQSLDEEYFVTAQDLANFVKYRRSASKRSDLAVKEVKSYGFDSSQTLFYILNYDKGWEVVAADKRIQPTLAHGDDGAFTMDCDNEPMKFWMNMLADGVLQMRLGNIAEDRNADATEKSADEKDSTSQDNVAFWNAISPSVSATKGGLTPTLGPLEPIEGIYRYAVDWDVEERVTVSDTLIVTNWGQGSPWNQFCPPVANNPNDLPPAGCTAVAAAQLMYFFYHSLGWQLMIPTQVTVNGDTDTDTRLYSFNLHNHQMFNNMAVNDDDTEVGHSTSCVAKLIVYAGHLSDMNYKPDASSADPCDFANSIEDLYGIESIHYDDGYSYPIVKNSILSGMPVLIWGYRENGKGHAWLIDGHKSTTTITTTYYVSFNTPQTQPFIDSLDKDDAHYSTTTSSTTNSLHMNWGWNGDHNDYYSEICDYWDIEISESDHRIYNLDIEFLYGFTRN